MKIKILIGILLAIVLLAGIGTVIAHGDFSEAENLIDSNLSCSELSDGQLEEIGDYYMEQMHPGEAHEIMHKMMGGHDSLITKEMHISMAKAGYCGESGQGMMGGGMMNMMGSGNTMCSGMMGSWGYGFGYWNFINILYAVLLVGLIILVYLWIIKLWKNMQNKK